MEIERCTRSALLSVSGSFTSCQSRDDVGFFNCSLLVSKRDKQPKAADTSSEDEGLLLPFSGSMQSLFLFISAGGLVHCRLVLVLSVDLLRLNVHARFVQPPRAIVLFLNPMLQ
jgi:hypothetical protein